MMRHQKLETSGLMNIFKLMGSSNAHMNMPCIQIKKKNGDFLLVYLYVDDLIFTGNNARMIQEFKNSMIRKFEMTDIGLMSYYLGIEVKQEEKTIFISQEAYANPF